MNISLLLWLVPTLLALLLLVGVAHYEWAWRRRRVVAEAAIGLLLASGLFLPSTEFGVVSQVLLGSLQLWMVLLGARLLFGRLPMPFLRTSTRLNGALALGAIVVIVDVWLVTRGLMVNAETVLSAVTLVTCVIVLGFVYQTLWTLKHYRLRKLDQALRPHDLPTVTLAIPARNETHALEATLRAAIASDYPKLEIIVLDDCSQDKTSEIIRGFAHDGVRFVQGVVPSEGWLGKNQAMATLAEHASGEYIVFADVDTHVSPQSIGKLITYALSHKQEMVTVLPTRRDGWTAATLFTPLRYYWQIVLPLTARRVPVASPCWLIRSKTLTKLGGFESVKQKIVPEAHFARVLFVHDQYRFVVSNDELGVTTAKLWSSHVESSLRFLYPTLKRQPLVALLALAVVVIFFIVPFGVLLSTPENLRLLVPSAVACGFLWLSYTLVVARTHAYTWPVTALLLPVALVQEVVLLVASMLGYEFGEVNWKGRNVCYPVIQRRR